jgi:nucleoside-diphosphate-sugar epimerase
MKNTQTVLVTGANGFVGQALVAHLSSLPQYIVRRSIRKAQDGVALGPHTVVAELLSDTDWTSALVDVNLVVHVAAMTRSTTDTKGLPIGELREINVKGTLNLARQAALIGAKRFVFISSIKVFGEESSPESPFTESDTCRPQEAYAFTKMEAEQGLRQIAENCKMEVVIIRAPLIYGPGVGANFKTLIRAVARGLPLPLGAVNNRRSLVAIDNLVDFILICLAHPRAANEIFSISDGDDLSTPELVRRIGRSLNRPVRLLAIPVPILKAAAVVLGKRNIFQKLCGTLQVDIAKSARILGWKPPVRVDDALFRALNGKH